MIRRLEQVAALVVAAGLALVSYWLFFSWARGGGSDERLPGSPRRSLETAPSLRLAALQVRPGSETPARLQQPAAGAAVVEAGQMGLHQFGGDGKTFLLPDLHDA